MAAAGERDGAAVLQLLDAQKEFKTGGVARVAIKHLSAPTANARDLALLVGVDTTAAIDAFTLFRSLDPSFVAALISSPPINEDGAPTACIVRRASDVSTPADIICLDLDGLGGAGPALSWLDANSTSSGPTPVVVAVGSVRINLDEFDDRIDGVIGAPPERGLANSWLRALDDWWKARTEPTLIDAKAALELGAVDPEDVDEVLLNAALDDDDPRKQD